MRLIDADELIVMEYGGIRFVPKEFIDDAPTVDAIEVVRCEHCLAYDSFKNGIEGFCRKMGKVMCGSDFCSYAERRTDE